VFALILAAPPQALAVLKGRMALILSFLPRCEIILHFSLDLGLPRCNGYGKANLTTKGKL
jgi:hypothetical protein